MVINQTLYSLLLASSSDTKMQKSRSASSFHVEIQTLTANVNAKKAQTSLSKLYLRIKTSNWESELYRCARQSLLRLQA